MSQVIAKGMVAGLYRPKDFVGRMSDGVGVEFVFKRIIKVINSYAILHLINEV